MSAQDKVAIAVIGAGFICDYHVAGIRAAGTGEVTTLVGRNRDRTARRASDLGIAQVSTDHKQVLDDPSIDAVVIATPDVTHKPLAIQALAANKSVLLQKPMAMSSEECRIIVEAASRSTGRLSVSFMHRYLPEVRWLRDRLREGEFGKLHAIRLHNATPGAGWADWFFDPAKVAGGVVMQLGVHGIDLVQHLFGSITEVSARTATMKPTVRIADGRTMRMPFEDNVVAVYRLASGVNVSHEMSWTEVAGCDRFRLEVYFERAAVWLRTDAGPALVNRGGANGWEPVDLADEPFGRAHHADWLEGVRSITPSDDTAEAGLSTLLVSEHIYRAADEGRTLSVPT